MTLGKLRHLSKPQFPYTQKVNNNSITGSGCCEGCGSTHEAVENSCI